MKHIHKIRYGNWVAHITPDRGANCIALLHTGYGASLLREPPAGAEPYNPFLYGMPILFPVNRIQGGRFVFDGREYVFPINEPSSGCHLHGELHQMPFTVIRKQRHAIHCRFTATPDRPYLSFSHEFSIDMIYELREDGLYHTVTVNNHSPLPMPILLGFHTTFRTRFLRESKPEEIRLFAGIEEEYERNMHTDYLPTGRKPAFDALSESLAKGTCCPSCSPFSRHYRGSGKMSITDLGRHLRVVYENDEKYTFRLIYSGDDSYVCLEPQNCLVNAPLAPFLQEETALDSVAPGKSRTYRSKIYLEEF